MLLENIVKEWCFFTPMYFMRIRQFVFFAILLTIAFFVFTDAADAKLPFIVRTIYFQPTNAPDVPSVKIKSLMKQTQAFYRSEMERLDYGSKTFRLETDGNGEPIIHVVQGRRPSHVYTSYQAVEPDLPNHLKNKNNIHVFFMGGMQFVKPGALGVGFPFSGGACGGIVRTATLGEGFRSSVVAHELGHAFGLYHNLKKGNFLMGHGRTELDDYEARWLDKHHYFNSVHEINAVPKIVKVHQTEHVAIRTKGVNFQEKEGVRFRIDVSSRNALHQGQILRASDTAIVGWTKGNGTTILIDVLRSDVIRDRTAYLEVMDVQGNYIIHTIQFTLPKIPQPENDVETKEKDASVSPKKKLTAIWAKLKSI